MRRKGPRARVALAGRQLGGVLLLEGGEELCAAGGLLLLLLLPLRRRRCHGHGRGSATAVAALAVEVLGRRADGGEWQLGAAGGDN